MAVHKRNFITNSAALFSSSIEKSKKLY